MIHHTNSVWRCVYLMDIRDEKIVRLVTCAEEHGPGPTSSGLEDEHPPADLLDVFASGEPHTIGPYTYERGTFVSGFAAVKDFQTGQVLAVAGIDIDATDYGRLIAQARLAPISVTLLVSVLFTGFFFARQRLLESGRAIRELSLTDELTGSYNRRGFQTLAGQELKVAARLRQNLTLLYADLDGLKRINDSFGHKEGDRALVDTANILKGNQRASDIIARLGGDEFVVLTIETSNGGSEVMAARLQAGIAAHNARG
jgi:GGDEF domain-containing protein